MFNLEKKEKLIILILAILLLAGLAVSFYRNKAPSVDVKANAFVPDMDTEWQPKKININEADEKAIEGLDGIGKVLALRIVEYRSQNGDFRSIEDLKKVKGIGEKLFEKIKDKVCID